MKKRTLEFLLFTFELRRCDASRGSNRIGAIRVSSRVMLLSILILLLVSCGPPNDDEQNEASERITDEESVLQTLTLASSPSEALRVVPLSAGDKVRIVPSRMTDELGISGLKVEVIAVDGSGSHAAVRIKVLGQYYGMSRNMLELVDLPVGTSISIHDKTWISNQDGEWVEVKSDR